MGAPKSATVKKPKKTSVYHHVKNVAKYAGKAASSATKSGKKVLISAGKELAYEAGREVKKELVKGGISLAKSSLKAAIANP